MYPLLSKTGLMGVGVLVEHWSNKLFG